MYTYIYIYIHFNIHKHIQIKTYIDVCIHMYVCMYICMYLYIYTLLCGVVWRCIYSLCSDVLLLPTWKRHLPTLFDAPLDPRDEEFRDLNDARTGQ